MPDLREHEPEARLCGEFIWGRTRPVRALVREVPYRPTSRVFACASGCRSGTGRRCKDPRLSPSCQYLSKETGLSSSPSLEGRKGQMMRRATWNTVINSLLINDGELRDSYVSFREGPFAGEEPVIVTSEDEWELGDSEVPSAARTEGMTECLDDSQIEDVLVNLRLQKTNASTYEVLEAIRYVVDNDAFIEV